MSEKTQSQRIAEYRSALQTVVLCATMLAQHDLLELLRAIEHSETTAPILDPTLWIKNGKAMQEDKEMFRAALSLRELGVKLAKMRAGIAGGTTP